MRWYGDNSELNGLQNAPIPDTLLFGGLAIDAEQESALRRAVDAFKSAKFGDERYPIKWNMRDLQALYKKKGLEKEHRAIMESSREWRKEVFNILASHRVTVILSCISSYLPGRDHIREVRDNLIRFSFNNALMRFGLHAKESNGQNCQVVLDWPEGNSDALFNAEYAAAYNRGKTAYDQPTPYSCGKLRSLNFNDSIYFTKMVHSTMLQLADLTVGALREVVECSLGKKEAGQGVECIRLVREKLRGYPNRIMGRGISVSTGNTELREKISTGLKVHVLTATAR